MSTVEIATLSSKGQISIPDAIRNDLKISVGDKLAIIPNGGSILLKPIEKPAVKRFHKLIRESRKYAREIGLTGSDIASAIHKVRRENRR